MENLVAILIAKYKMFLYGMITGGVMQAFESKLGNYKFNFIKFLISSVVFGFLTEFSHLLIKGDFIDTDTGNESRVIVLSIMIASFLYLFLPFVLRKENRGKFIESLLARFGFYPTEQNNNVQINDK